MRLLHTQTLRLTEDFASPPPYAILSHAWDEEEILFEDIISPDNDIWRSKKGAAKVIDSCALAFREGHTYIWIDSCCINKSSSTELSEAINSMYRWYMRAEICYAFLSDVASKYDLPVSRWWTRGWTLQELIAPSKLQIFSQGWMPLGTREQLLPIISEITTIPSEVLVDRKDFADNVRAQRALRSICVAKRMSWADRRETTRPEDLAYSLLGIFDVNMPLLYGEGGYKAFKRLQEAIIRIGGDQSILVHSSSQIFAQSPSDFIGRVSNLHNRLSTMRYLEGELTLDVLICPKYGDNEGQVPRALAILDCTFDDLDHLGRPALLLNQIDSFMDGREIWDIADQSLYAIKTDGTIAKYDYAYERPDSLTFPRQDGEHGNMTIIRQYHAHNHKFQGFRPSDHFGFNLASACKLRIAVSVRDHQYEDGRRIEWRDDTSGIMIVSPSLSEAISKTFNITSVPRPQKQYLVSTEGCGNIAKSTISSSKSNNIAWLGIMIFETRFPAESLPLDVNLTKGSYFLVWGRHYIRPSPYAPSKPTAPWCRLLDCALLKTATLASFAQAETSCLQDISDEEIVQELSNFCTDSSTRYGPYCDGVTKTMGLLKEAILELGQDYGSTSSLVIGRNRSLEARLQPTTFLGNSTYALDIDEVVRRDDMLMSGI